MKIDIFERLHKIIEVKKNLMKHQSHETQREDPEIYTSQEISFQKAHIIIVLATLDYKIVHALF